LFFRLFSNKNHYHLQFVHMAALSACAGGGLPFPHPPHRITAAMKKKRVHTLPHAAAPAALKALAAGIAMAIPALAMAQAAATDTLPAVQVEAAGQSETTEGTGSYTTPGPSR